MVFPWNRGVPCPEIIVFRPNLTAFGPHRILTEDENVFEPVYPLIPPADTFSPRGGEGWVEGEVTEGKLCASAPLRFKIRARLCSSVAKITGHSCGTPGIPSCKRFKNRRGGRSGCRSRSNWS